MSAIPSKTRRPNRLRVLPITMGMLALTLLIKINDIYLHSEFLRQSLPSVAQAVAATDAPPAPPANDAAKDSKDSKNTPPAAPAREEKTLGSGKTSIEKIKQIKAEQQQEHLSPSEMDLLQNLTTRREQLDAREKDIDLKAKVLEATEGRINKRIAEMKKLQTDLQQVVEKYKTEQDGEIKGLVKIYENMKPVNAAAIFNTLDIDILLSVIDNMSERKVAPILAAMQPARAQDVTERLAELRQLRAHTAQKATELGK
jgi:flagellar motility protein MotE (MotC chaperone)